MTGVGSLWRYWIWANRFKLLFDKEIAKGQAEPKTLAESWIIFMFAWYGNLYSVVEGWQHLALSDSSVDSLLASDNVDLLRKLRNAVFHFQEPNIDKRITNFMREPTSVAWVRKLHDAFGEYFEGLD